MFEKNKESYGDGQVRNIADSYISVVERETEKREKVGQPVSMAPLLNDEQITALLGDLFGAVLTLRPSLSTGLWHTW